MTSVKQGKALNIKESRILIAGAASLVGSHTADLLLKDGAREVLLLDNFSFGSIDAIAHLQNDPRIKSQTRSVQHGSVCRSWTIFCKIFKVFHDKL